MDQASIVRTAPHCSAVSILTKSFNFMEKAKASTPSAAQTSTATKVPERLLILGGTGAIGRCVVAQLVRDPRAKNITLFGRRVLTPFPGLTPEETSRIHQKVFDFDQIDKHKEEFNGFDAVLCCLGTQRGKVDSDEAFIKVDKTYVVNAAKAAREAKIDHFSMVTALGAKSDSWFLYPRTKGQAEEEVVALKFPHTTILRPSLLLAEREEKRWAETLAAPFTYLGGNYSKGIKVERVAKVMIEDVFQPKKPVAIYENSEMHQMAFSNF